VLLGNDVKDAWFQEAEMEGLGSAPPAMEDERALGVKSLQPGFTQSDSDAESAYLQEYLKSKYVTWIHPPKEFWPEEWHGKYYKPVCILKLALYGHADSGGYWEEKSYGDAQACGWEPVPDRIGVFYKPKEDALMMIHVDDFKMSCRIEDEDRLWKQLQARIRLSDYKRSDRYLGCYSRQFTAPVSKFAPTLANMPSQWTRKNDEGEKRTQAIPWKPVNPDKQVIRL
jgi:hypothetical protein